MKDDSMTPPKDSPESQATDAERWEEMARDAWEYARIFPSDAIPCLTSAFAQVAAESAAKAREDDIEAIRVLRQAAIAAVNYEGESAYDNAIAVIRALKSPSKESKP